MQRLVGEALHTHRPEVPAVAAEAGGEVRRAGLRLRDRREVVPAVADALTDIHRPLDDETTGEEHDGGADRETAAEPRRRARRELDAPVDEPPGEADRGGHGRGGHDPSCRRRDGVLDAGTGLGRRVDVEQPVPAERDGAEWYCQRRCEPHAARHDRERDERRERHRHERGAALGEQRGTRQQRRRSEQGAAE